MKKTAATSLLVLLACAISFGAAPLARAEAAAPPGHGGPGSHDGGHGMGDPLAMLTATLNLSADQQTQAKAIFEATHAQAKVVADDTTLSQDDKMAKMKGLHEAAMEKVKALLTPAQQQKFEQAQGQMMHGPGMGHHAPGSMGDPVAKLTTELNLTADQQAQARAIFEDMHPKMKMVEDDQTLSQDDKMTRMKELRDATHTKIKALLTPDQQQKFDRMMQPEHGGPQHE